MPPERLYERADKEVHHYLRLIAGHLSASERRAARLLLIRAVFARAQARAGIEQAELIAA